MNEGKEERLTIMKELNCQDSIVFTGHCQFFSLFPCLWFYFAHLFVDKKGEGQWGREGEGSIQGTCIRDPWTKTMEGRLNVEGEEVVRVGRGMGESGDNCI